jgi:hypothetical protein
VSSPQIHILSVEVMGDEAIPEGVVEIDQLNLGHSKERNFSSGVELNVVDASPGFGVLDGEVSVGGQEGADDESRQGVAAVSGQGVLELGSVEGRGAEPEPSVVTRKLDRSMEVSVIAGLSCDGQVGRQIDCLKRIIVKKNGEGEDSIHPADQQTGDSSVRE